MSNLRVGDSRHHRAGCINAGRMIALPRAENYRRESAQWISSYIFLRILLIRGLTAAHQTAFIPCLEIKEMNEVGHARRVPGEAVTVTGPAAFTTRVVGTTVFDRQNKYFGRIEDIVIVNRIAYALISFGGFLGIGKAHCAAPLKALHHDSERYQSCAWQMCGHFVTGITIDES